MISSLPRYWINDLEEEYDDSGEILVHEDTKERITGLVWEDYGNGYRRYEAIYENGVLESVSIYYRNRYHGESWKKIRYLLTTN